MHTILFQENGKPLYLQIYEFFKVEIAEGKMPFGQKLPSKRKLGEQLSVSINTIDTAYGQLVAEGYIESVPKKGYYVCQIETYLQNSLPKLQEREPKEHTRPICIDFSPSDVEGEGFPFNAFRKIFKSAFHESDKSLLKKADVQGDYRLRHALVAFLYRSRGVSCTAEQIVIGSGTDHLLQLLGGLLGKEKTFVCENPVYQKAYGIFRHMGNPVLPIGMDEKGIQTEKLKSLSNMAIYVTPSNHFPLGRSMPIDRRMKLLNGVNLDSGSYIIEDDYDSEFRYSEKPLPSLQSIDKSGKVIYIGTFSKSIAPSIRVSYMVLPEALLEKYKKEPLSLNSTVSVLEQKMIASFIAEGGFDSHISKMRKIYRDKRACLVKELATLGNRAEIIGENAGHHLLVKLKTELSEAAMCKNALGYGVKVYPISQYFIGPMDKKYACTVLIGYGALTKNEISEGVHLLKQAWCL